ncbi:MAG: TIGR04086 family membrane protein [Clostridia bacterium]|nr:TIGR04086 family membrane protein [Clostridia bacterium]
MERVFKDKVSKNLIRIGKGIGISILITLLLLFIFSILLTFTNIPENTIQPVIIIISVISILIGSSISTIKINKNGIFNGSLVGIFYIIIIYLLSSITYGDFGFSLESVIMIILSIIAGMVGGIIGVNL